VFLSPPLKQDLRLSGVPEVDLQASLDKTQSNLGAIIVDYGPGTQITRSNDGLTLDKTQPKTCYGESSTRVDAQGNPIDYSACYFVAVKPAQTINATQGWRISRGVLDTSNRDSLFTATPIVPGQAYDFKIPMQPVDYTIPAGHQLGIVILTNYSDVGSTATTGATVTIDTKLSKVSLPILGGFTGAAKAGAFPATTTDGTAVGTVPATLSLSVGTPASFGSFTPGLAKTYTASTSANVISSAGNATLSVSDPGHLTNGAFSLPQPLQVGLSKSSWDTPVSNDPVNIAFTQAIGANDALRTGTYSGAVTFTLSTTAP
jgi:X-Pro dipeptidyl-peptidase